MRIISVFIAFLFIVPVSAQELSNQYLDYIPDSIKKSDRKLVKFSEKLEFFASIHPDLIYFYLTYSDKSLLAEASVNSFDIILEYYQSEKQSWKKNLCKYIMAMTNDDRIINKSKVIFYGDSITTEISDQALNKFDRNELHYVVLKYYDKKFDGKYDENVEYAQTRRSIEKERRNAMILACENSSNLKHLEKIRQNWYLFQESQDEDTAKIFKISLEILKNYYIENKSAVKQYGLIFGYTFVGNIFALDHKHTFDYTKLKLKCGKTLKSHSINLGLMYFYMRQNVYSGLFSYIRSELIFQYAHSPNVSYERSQLLEYSSSGVDYTESLDYSLDIKTNETYGLAFTFSLPFYIYEKSIALEAGLFAGAYLINYDLEYSYDYKKYEGSWREFYGNVFYETRRTKYESDKLVYAQSRVKRILLPLIRLQYDISPSIELKYSVSSNFLAVNIGYLF